MSEADQSGKPDPIAPFFLGAYGENNDFFERTLVELFRDHVYWRRNFHPEDVPPITPLEQYSPAYLEGLARTKRELHLLTAALKRSVPFFHPRYLGHMVSDVLMPGLIAQLITTLYNPNNIVEDAGPVTVQLELEVGLQLARLIGYDVDPARTPCALGHLASGGTLANDESVWLARAVKLFPLAVRDAAEVSGTWPGPMPRHVDDGALLAMAPREVVALAEALTTWAAADPRGPSFLEALSGCRAEVVGLGAFTARHPDVARLTVLVPGTAHYSWVKAMKLLGLGAANLVQVPTQQARLDVAELEVALAQCAAEHRPVLAVVGVYGTTEFGTLDPLHEVAALRARWPGFWFHVDAAWGGYLPAVVRQPDGGVRPREAVAAGFRYFPSERVYRSTVALREADSVTVDPHKLGFVPYGAGALVVKDRRVLDLVVQDAPYVFTSAVEGEARYRKLGRFILEGSKPGAAAAACYVNHRVLPLDHENFGALIARSIRTTEHLVDKLQELADRLEDRVKLTAPFEPDCNLVCVALNPVGNTSLKASNAFTRKVFDTMAVRADRPVQLREFFGSCTTVSLAQLGVGEARRIFGELGLGAPPADDEGLFVLRHTLMNPWLMSAPGPDEPSYLDAYCTFIESTVTGLLDGR